MNKTTKEIVLKVMGEKLERLYNNLSCYSQDWLCQIPIPKLAEEHCSTKTEIEKLEKAMKEIYDIIEGE